MRRDVLTETEFSITRDAVQHSATKIIPSGNIVIATRVGLGKVCLLGQDTAINQDLRGIVPRDKSTISIQFLFWWFKSIADKIVSEGTGATVQGVKLPFIQSLLVPQPPLEEQRRLVEIIERTFEGVTTAGANAEKNIDNARALFDGQLYKEHPNEVPLGDLVRITTGKLDANAAVEGGRYPFFTCAREVYAIDDYAFDCEAILLAGNNAVGDFNVKHYKGKFNAYQRTYVINVHDPQRLRYRFLYFQLLRGLSAFKKQSVGTGTKFLKMPIIRNLPVYLPTLEEQDQIVSRMDSILEDTDELRKIYQQKLGALAALKTSILHEAFAGSL
jgi:type I restriction enzyme S subunit